MNPKYTIIIYLIFSRLAPYQARRPRHAHLQTVILYILCQSNVRSYKFYNKNVSYAWALLKVSKCQSKHLKSIYEHKLIYQVSMPDEAILDIKSYLYILVCPDSLVWSSTSKQNMKRLPHSVQNHNVFKSSSCILCSWYNIQTIWFKWLVTKSYSFYLNFYAELWFTLVMKYNIIFDFSENSNTE
jgi:hypothetical protein